jgi:TonB-linked SusC/RagA family outer membrane protein
MKRLYQKYVSKLLLTVVVSMLMLTVKGQNVQVSGTVTDASGAGVPSASVVIKGTKTGTATNDAGNFVISAKKGDVLSISYTGFETQEITVGAQTKINIKLKESDKDLEEIVVVGYGTQRRSKVTASIAKLDSKVLETGMRSNPAQALAGTIPGVRVSTGSGRPGSLPTITLRGGTNFDGSGSPLILIDGQVRNSLSDINPEDIASMEVLKDASATAIYGARASNGVILITSKKGKSGISTVTVKAKTGVSYLNSPYDYLNAEDYIKWTRLGVVEAMRNGTLGTFASNTALSAVGPRSTGNIYKDAAGNIADGNYDNRAIWSTMRLTDANKELLSQPGWKTMKDAVKTNAAGNYDPNGTFADLIFKDFNYGDYAFKPQAITQDYNVGFNGGNEKGHYYANVGYYNENGLPLSTFYRRLNFTFNGDYKIKDWLTSESSVQYTKANWKDQTLQNGEGNYWGRMLSAPPTMRGTNANGELLLGRDNSDGNPVVNADKFKINNQTDKFTLNQAFRVDLAKDLNVRVGGILFYDEDYRESFNKDFRTGVMSLTNPATGWNRDRSSAASFTRNIKQTYNAVLNYSTQFLDKHNVSAMAGFEYFDSYEKGLNGSGRLAPTDDFQDLALTVGAVANVGARNIDSYHVRERILSQFGRLNYDFDGKYLASFTVRRDGFSRLAGDNQYGIFPAVSVGWLLHQEDFLASTKNWLSYLKLRGSWGKNGNIGIGTSNAVGLYEVQGAYGPTNAYNGSVGFLNTPANPNLKWEKTNTVEAGLEFGLFDNRVTAQVAAYNRNTTDKLAFIEVPLSSGVNSIRTNNGSMRNRGVEMEANYKILKDGAVKWEIGANAAWNKNLVTKLPFNGNENNRQGGRQVYDPATKSLIWVAGLQEGHEPGEIYGFVSDGIIRNAADLAAYNKVDIAAGQVWYGGSVGKKVASQALITAKNLNAGTATFIATQLGDMKWKDIDGNDTIDTRDMVSLGRTLPRWQGGFNTSLSYKGFNLYARVDFALGHRQMDFQQMWTLGSFQGEFNATQIVKDTWTPENPDAKFPRYTWADQLNAKNFDRPSGMFIVNSGYLAFREVSLSYSLPAKLLQKAKVSGLTFTATGQNLGYITNKMISLPERTGEQSSAYAIPTQLIFGMNLTF